ncbi:hypothetical protein RJ639_040782 [Escallonia herrerae]|uniref:NPH3 domain-containing protein n=1 Tax=Escallonia herrerae TaxID=1293975 RepID=A0AA88WI97_9ASTE|nr:hypothetical protein RJ639_040782 [Escallonia herrerae]
MKKVTLPESPLSPSKSAHFAAQCWFEDACILDMDYFVKTLSSIKAKGIRSDLIGSIITHYASKWLPDLSGDAADTSVTSSEESPESATASWMKKRFFIETMVGILPPEKNSVPCNFLLRLLRAANKVGVDLTYRTELEKRVSWQLDEASLVELMIPCFGHTCATLLDVELVLRLVKKFVNLDEGIRSSGAAMVKVAKLVDCYLAEAAVDANLSLPEFVRLAGAIPVHARASDDGLYRAIDTYLKAHPGASKQERKTLCRLIDSRKLSPDASLHAAQNERLPVRSVIQVLLSEQSKLNRHLDWSGSFSATKSPNLCLDHPPGRCHSEHEMTTQKLEIRKLKDDVLRLQSQCFSLQGKMERLVLEKRKGFFSWKKLGLMPSLKSSGVANKIEKGEIRSEIGYGRQTPIDTKGRLVRGKTSTSWRKSIS